MNERLIEMLKPIPTYPSVKSSDESVYFVFNYYTHGANYGDNKPLNEHYHIQLHLFCPDDFDSFELRRDTKTAIFENGFTYPGMVDASDEEGQHWVFEFEDVE